MKQNYSKYTRVHDVWYKFASCLVPSGLLDESFMYASCVNGYNNYGQVVHTYVPV